MARDTISVKHLYSREDLGKELNWEDFSLISPIGKTISKDSFTLVAIGNPNRDLEKWEMDIKDERYNSQEDLIYALVIDEKLFKLGKSITTMKKRVSSYHCGKDAYRKKENSTNSATNWFVLQSTLSINLPVFIYVLYIPQTEGQFMGWKFKNRISKEIEAILISEFQKKYNFKPIGNKQN